MDDVVTRFVTDLVGRLSGPLTLRLFLQPAMATFLAWRDGMKDARENRPPHFWQMLTGGTEVRQRRAKETWAAVLKVFSMAVILDCVYQWVVFRWIYPMEAIATAVILAILPYLLLRGVFNRIARTWIQPHGGPSR